jgi:hypothetical protein
VVVPARWTVEHSWKIRQLETVLVLNSYPLFALAIAFVFVASGGG